MFRVPWPCLRSVGSPYAAEPLMCTVFPIVFHLQPFPRIVWATWPLTALFWKTLLPLENSGIWVGVNCRWREDACSRWSVGCVYASAQALLFIVAQSNQTSVSCSVPGLAAPISPQDWNSLGTREVWVLRLCIKWAKELSKTETLRFVLFCHKIDRNLCLVWEI